jgi:serine phosphatase RsbU (regulator of sigma subunit)
VLSLTFPLLGVDDVTQNDFVATLADTLAQAIDRALTIERLAETNVELGALNDRLTFLADASAALSGSLDYGETLDAITSFMVPRLADWCSIQLLDDSGQLRTAALAHPDPARIEWARDLGQRFPTRMDASFGAAKVIRTGRSELYPEIPAELLERAASGPGHLAIIRELALSSALVVPLAVDGEILGALTLIFAESGRRYGPGDVAFVEDVARRAARAMQSATTFRAQTGRLADVQRVADAAQRAILAPPPQQLGPIRLAARYVAAAAEAQVGGDFYEVVARHSGARLLIGDVRGKGLAAVRTATVVMGEFRAARRKDNLAEVAARLDRRMRPYLGDEDFVTALLADLNDDGTVEMVSCGHPSPLHLTGSQITEVGLPAGLPLGLGAAPDPARMRLAPGERLLLYTDGAIEARDRERRFIDLASVLQPALGLDPPALLEAVVSGLHRQAGQTRFGDDLALLLAEYGEKREDRIPQPMDLPAGQR